ncbi:LAFE_0H17810g1_1 [Lachancea fermentati]|uniref:LAFE_0H17810g1_1 n=1 Tax=Lachancea fermentati TaxID=4955 RepID=A0A1G4MLG2_LACFM|nr:LAFE_0H17810g1_1 [Lachancea fermentati]
MKVSTAIRDAIILEGSTSMQNKDIVPIPIKRRRWGYYGYISYWAINSLCVSTWSAGSSLLSMGLNGSHTIGIVIVANALISIAAILNSVYGSEYHIGYSVYQRIIFGIRGSYIGVLIRVILSVVWFASQSWLGGLCVNVLISSWSKNYLNMSNSFPASVNMSTQELVGFIIYLVISIPFLMVRPEYFDTFLAMGSCAVFFVGMGITIWAVHDNENNYGNLMNTKISLSKSEVAWIWIYGINSWYSSLVAGISNQSDFSRFNSRPIHSYVGTIVGCNLMGFIVPLFGILTASAMLEKYGEQFWMPNDICMFWLEQNYSSKARAGAFFCGLGLVISQLSINCVGNAISGGMDLSSIFPKYINIRRGAIVILLLAWPTQPWLFYNTSSTFLTVMSSFSVFITPLVAIYISEYFYVRRRILKLSHCYINTSDSLYWYHGGFNFKAILCFLCGCAPGLPGLINAANPGIEINLGIYHFYEGSFIFQFAITFLLYMIASHVWKSPVGDRDDIDLFDTYTIEECSRIGMVPFSEDKEEDQSSYAEHYTVQVLTEKVT